MRDFRCCCQDVLAVVDRWRQWSQHYSSNFSLSQESVATQKNVRFYMDWLKRDLAQIAPIAVSSFRRLTFLLSTLPDTSRLQPRILVFLDFL